MVKHSVHVVAAGALLLFAGSADAVTAPLGISSLTIAHGTITPEPAWMLLFGIGLAGLAVRRLRVAPVPTKK